MISDIRKMQGVEGAIYFSSKTFEKNPNGWNDSLQRNYYKSPAIVPPMPWIDSASVEKPVVSVTIGPSNGIGTTLSIQNLDTLQKLRAFVVYAFDKGDTIKNTAIGRNIVRIIPATTNRVDYLVLQQDLSKQFAVSSVNSENNESEPVFLPPLFTGKRKSIGSVKPRFVAMVRVRRYGSCPTNRPLPWFVSHERLAVVSRTISPLFNPSNLSTFVIAIIN